MEWANDDLLERADLILDRLLDLPEAKRLAALQGMSVQPELDACVRRLLRAHYASGTLDRPLPHNPGAFDAARLAGRRIGDWVLQRELGSGGMSVVWQACRGRDGSEQRAALKLLSTGALGRHHAQQFRREQAILARLNHPHIAHLYQAGQADDGTPYLAMELVEGERIDDWCDQHDLDMRQRIGLMLDVCAAISYAHRNLVVHADLKPSNVMVDGEGHVRVLDFGIGRLLDANRDHTRTAWRALTPEYAASEQVHGGAITTATDVFGLGALLYRLLTGLAPRERTTGVEITAPSRVQHRGSGDSAARCKPWSRQLRGDLDTILQKALAQEPERRYHSVDALAADLQAWLQRRPITARAPSRRYRLRKFAVRHRLALAAGLALAVVLLGGLGATLWQARRARLQAARATAVKEFLVDILASADPTRVQGRDPRASELLREGARHIRTALGDRPQVRAELLLVIGRSQLARGLLADARQSLGAALRLFEDGTATDPRVHAGVLSEDAMLAYEQGRNADALTLLHRAASVLGDDASADSRVHDQVMARLADMYVVNDRPASAMDTANRLLAAMRQGGRQGNYEYSYALRTLGEAANLQEHYVRALQWLGKASDALVSDPHPVDQALIDNEMGIAYDGLGKETQAAHALSAALALQTRVYGTRHPATLATLANLASIHLRQGRAARAAAEYQRIVPMQQAIVGTGPHPDVVNSLGWLALARYRMGRTAAAWEAVQQGLAMKGKLPSGEQNDLRWLPPLAGLLGWELQRPGAGALLDRGGFVCADLDRLHVLGRWVCLARALRDADAGHCRAPRATPPSTDPVDGIDRRWWAVFHLLRGRCGDRSRRAAELRMAHALAAGAKPAFPDWLRTRLAAAAAPIQAAHR